MPVDYVRASDLGKSRDCFTFTLEYGAGHDEIDPFDIAVGREWEDAHKHDDRYLHPVVRHYRHGTLFEELRLKENLDNDWTDETEHRKPLREFIAGQLAADSARTGTDREAPEQPDPATQRPQFVNVRDVEEAARKLLDPVHYDYFVSGAQDEVTMRANEAGFGRLALVPRVLRGAGEPTLDVSLLGCDTSAPILLAPTAFHRLAHPDAELATARAAAATGTIMIAAMLSTVAIENSPRPPARSQQNPRCGSSSTSSPTSDSPRRSSGAPRPPAVGRWWSRRTRLLSAVTSATTATTSTTSRQACGARTSASCAAGSRAAFDRYRCRRRSRGATSIGCEETSDLPILVKGILHPEDARLAIDRGVDALIVSNHGGRQLDTAPATIEQLPRIVEAVDGRVPVLLDGGIRRGTDVAKALALGADAVAVGRPALWGLAADGERGVVSVLEILRNELAHTLTLCGAASPRDLSRDQVQERPC